MERIKNIIKWSTEALSVVILGLVCYIIGAHLIEGLPNISDLSSVEIQLSVAMGGLFLGTLIGLKWELIGGVLTILGYIAFAIIDQNAMLGTVFYLFLMTGVLNLIIYFLNRKD